MGNSLSGSSDEPVKRADWLINADFEAVNRAAELSPGRSLGAARPCPDAKSAACEERDQRDGPGRGATRRRRTRPTRLARWRYSLDGGCRVGLRDRLAHQMTHVASRLFAAGPRPPITLGTLRRLAHRRDAPKGLWRAVGTPLGVTGRWRWRVRGWRKVRQSKSRQ